MANTLTHKLIAAHLVEGELSPGVEIGLRIDQTLTQDATGTLVMLELEAMGVDGAKTELSAQYVDHNLLQEDYKNPDDHRFLRSACEKFGIWFSGAGNGVSHPVHQQFFGAPGKTLLGSDSHTCAAGALGMLAMGAGGMEVALAIAGEPFYVVMPEVWNIRLEGILPPWVSAKDVILELLRRHGVKGGVGKVLEYTGPGLDGLSAMDRHVIANMGAELGATASVFPADEAVRAYLEAQGRGDAFESWHADEGASYDGTDTVKLDELEPLIAMPTSPGNVKRVREVEGEPIHQAYIGSSANPGFRDFAAAAAMVDGRHVHPAVSFDINPTSRGLLAALAESGALLKLIQSGARIHQAGCNGCIGMGQAPATDTISLRTTPRNFPGRSGTKEDKVCLVSPETATASALRGVITDPRDLEAEGFHAPEIDAPRALPRDMDWFIAPKPADERANVALEKGPNIVTLPEFEALPKRLELPILLKMGDDISTDEILPAGANVLPLRSNIQGISAFSFAGVSDDYANRAKAVRDSGGHAVIAGENYGQGSSREHAALAPRYLGLRLVLVKSFARIHWQNLANFGVVALTFAEAGDYAQLKPGDTLTLDDGAEQLRAGRTVTLKTADGETIRAEHRLSPRQVENVCAGGIINAMRNMRAG